MSLHFVLTAGGPSVILTDNVLQTLNRFQQTSQSDKEAGGQLFAVIKGADTLIVEATTPKWLDKRSRYGFWPNRWFQQREIKNYYQKGLHFVGDWHTHPQAIPYPSNQDIENTIECFKTSRHELSSFITIIVGTMAFPEGLYLALINSKTTRKLEIDKV